MQPLPRPRPTAGLSVCPTSRAATSSCSSACSASFPCAAFPLLRAPRASGLREETSASVTTPCPANREPGRCPARAGAGTRHPRHPSAARTQPPRPAPGLGGTQRSLGAAQSCAELLPDSPVAQRCFEHLGGDKGSAEQAGGAAGATKCLQAADVCPKLLSTPTAPARGSATAPWPLTELLALGLVPISPGAAGASSAAAAQAKGPVKCPCPHQRVESPSLPSPAPS